AAGAGAGLALRPLLRGRLRRLRRAVALDAELLRERLPPDAGARVDADRALHLSRQPAAAAGRMAVGSLRAAPGHLRRLRGDADRVAADGHPAHVVRVGPEPGRLLRLPGG